jgi:hypothetical protein
VLGRNMQRRQDRFGAWRGAWMLYTGDYSAVINYYEQDCVTYSGGTYVCIKKHGPAIAGTSAQFPTATTYWKPLGGGGSGGGNMNFRGEFDPSGATQYVPGDCVVLRGGISAGFYFCFAQDPAGESVPTYPYTAERWILLAPGHSAGFWV